MAKLICDIDFLCKHKLVYITIFIIVMIISMISGVIFMHYSQINTNNNILKTHEKMMVAGRGSFAVSGKSSS